MGNILLTDQETEKIQTLFDDLQTALKDSQVLPETIIQAGYLGRGEIEQSFSARYEVNDWFNSVNRAIMMFRVSFLALHRTPDKEVYRSWGKDRNQAAQDLLADLAEIINQKIKEYPEQACDEEFCRESFVEEHHPVHAQAKSEESGETETEDKVEDDNETSEIEIKASADAEIPITEKEYDLNLSFDFPAEAQEIAASKADEVQGATNKLPFEGVLFRIDEPSESAPSKGSLLPLYIPMQLARQVVEQINESGGLPLDMHETLAQHANEQIAGIMNHGEIQGNDLVVRGHLFPWSQRERVALISANRERLGMSMNARARGHEMVVEGKKVWWIDDIELLGANILFSDAATYQKTRVIAAAEQRSLDVEIAANRLKEDDKEIEMDPETKERLVNLSSSISTLIEAAKDDSKKMESRFDTVLEAIETQGAAIRNLQQFQSTIEQERETITAQRRQEQTLEERKQERDELLAEMRDMTKEIVASSQTELLNRINPRRQPSRIVPDNLVPVAASNATSQPQDLQLSGKHARLNYLKGAIDSARQSGTVGSHRLGLIEEFKALCDELGVSR